MQYPPSSPPAVSTPARRALLPSFEPNRPSGHRKSVSASPAKRTPSRKRVRAATPTSDDDGDATRRGRARSSSSPSLDRVRDSRLPRLLTFYPTPAPTSSLETSSPAKAEPFRSPRNDADATVRAPLSTVVLVQVPRSGALVTLGRSSNSSNYVLSRTNKLISRVHVTARFVDGKVEVTCMGWNGARVGAHALAKGESVQVDGGAVIDVCGERARVELFDDDETDEEEFVSDKSPQTKIKPAAETDNGPSFSVWEDNNAAVAAEATATTTELKTVENDTIEVKVERMVERASAEPDLGKLKTHIIAHLAYSRLATTPLSELRAALPITDTLPVEILRSIIKAIPAVGVIQREGKDASGKRLEEQYYYIPDQDEDEHRRAAVEELRGHPGIRSCRKVHKQYFWRKPNK